MTIAGHSLTRRAALIGAGVGGGALAAVLTAPGAAAAAESQGFEGAWLVHVVPTTAALRSMSFTWSSRAGASRPSRITRQARARQASACGNPRRTITSFQRSNSLPSLRPDNRRASCGFGRWVPSTRRAVNSADEPASTFSPPGAQTSFRKLQRISRGAVSRSSHPDDRSVPNRVGGEIVCTRKNGSSRRGRHCV
jgi:hypothetical protein